MKKVRLLNFFYDIIFRLILVGYLVGILVGEITDNRDIFQGVTDNFQ